MKKLLEFIKNNFKDILVSLLAVISVYFFYKWMTEKQYLYEELIGQKESYIQINEKLAKLEVKYKNQKDLNKEQKKKFSEVILEKDEKIKVLSESIFTHKNKTVKRMGSDLTKKNYVYNEIRLEGPDSPPVGWVMLSKDGNVRSGTYKFDIVVDNLQTVDTKTGRVKVYSQAYYVVKQDGLANRSDSSLKKWKNEKYPLKIIGGTAIVDPTEASKNTKKQFFIWAPRLGMGLNQTVDSKGFRVVPNINMSLSGYGVSKNDLDYRFMEIGVGASSDFKNPQISIKPVIIRPIKRLPNTYIGPGVTYSPNSGFGGTIGLTVTF